ncbi:bifunctional serine/threonine-protein kinase/ABC transporter substrate-binding protein [Streptomyces sp. MAR4 CNX-425]|uniref:bifunctional serine/threonine-protein kinase/ABC transporter substrate-binding protein n=1 Tax=Streptomyces sp. MAR4 CNX-425 TaxID=3406343 RepID=UPI003B5037AE
MRPLTPDDPRAIGGHRVLARLGAGGMGAVYLARTPGGALAAVKVIQAEHAADRAFRDRFRREVDAARRIAGRWAVPVVGADAESPEPWLATAYEPGPSLAEAVAEFGPLPVRSVRLLGVRLAEALADVHAAGLLHRDVKPGNVLLALDGPRLIDFGIVRVEGAGALTRSGVVVGTPGYLPPEQAREEKVGPAGDVFSLGCVLAYASCGVRPFGHGLPAGVMFRTVREPADLSEVPEELLEPLTACLAKDPARRPEPAELARWLGGDGVDGGDWLPPGPTRLIAERSARVLDLRDPPPPASGPGPEAEPTQVTSGTPPPRPGRRRLLVTGAGAAVLLAGGGTAAVAAWRRGDGGEEAEAAAGPDRRPTHTVAVHADLSGPGRATGLAHERGARLAVERHNADSGRPFRLRLTTKDDGGEPDRAREVAERLVRDDAVVGVIGPTADATARAAVPVYEKGRLPEILVSPGAGGFSWATPGAVCTLRQDYSADPVALVLYLTNERPSRRTAVVRDAAGGRVTWEIARSLRTNPPAGGTVREFPVAAGGDFAPAARDAAGWADAVVYAGASPQRAARCSAALDAAGFTGPRCAIETVWAPPFLDPATSGSASPAEGWVLAAAHLDPRAARATREFAAAHEKRFGEPPGYWSAEVYDAVGLLAKAVRDTSGSPTDGGAVTERLFRTTHQGVTKKLVFRDATRQLRPYAVFLYRVEDGAPRFLGHFEKFASPA